MLKCCFSSFNMKFITQIRKLNFLKFIPGLLGLATFYLSSCATPTMSPSAPVPAYSESANALTGTDSPKLKARSAQYQATPKERPGLGTGWGDDISSSVNFTSFTRASDRPVSISSIYYNDKEGIKAMTSSWSYNGKGMQKAANGLVEWGVKGNWGYLKNKHSNGKRFVIGSKNQNYALVVKNLCKSPLEIVMSVDGLDILDGKAASLKKRGYIIQPGATLTVKGFRKSADAVAAFKFASVSSSYTNLSGKGTRNIGVIGIAVFTQKGVDPWKYGKAELNNRKNASPFAEAPQLRAR